MGSYLLRRLLLVIPTLFGIIAINFAVVQLAPGGPVEQAIAELRGHASMSVISGGSADIGAGLAQPGAYRGASGMDPRMLADIRKMFGFDKPPLTRFLDMVGGYLRFDFGRSFFRGQSVLALIEERLPVSLSLGLWSTLLIYVISIPLGIRKAVRDGSRFDAISSGMILVGYAIPSFLLAILLIVLFAGGSYWHVFPLRGLASVGASAWPWPARLADYGWHLVLPVASITAGGFASLTLLMKNSFLEEIRKQYTVTARAKGASDRRVLYGHVFRNASLLLVAGFPQAFITILFTSQLLVEIVFSLNGLGELGFQAAIQRDYPVMFGTLYIFTLIGLVMQIVGDLLYTVVDPRIDFAAR
ncbi:MAG: microcin C ABC transporter permease YejB [Acetobacteraceae bacterium]